MITLQFKIQIMLLLIVLAWKSDILKGEGVQDLWHFVTEEG